jgi:hypothetical protein
MQYQDRQRGLVNVSESEMPAAGDIIELVAKVAVATASQQMDEEGCSTEENY